MLQRKAQGACEGLEDGLALVVCVEALEIVDVHGHTRMVDEALEEFVDQLGVKLADAAGREFHVHVQARAAREIDDHAAQGLVQRRSEERRVGKECRSRWSPY